MASVDLKKEFILVRQKVDLARFFDAPPRRHRCAKGSFSMIHNGGRACQRLLPLGTI